MAKTKKITQNINKDAGLMDLPRVSPHKSTWETKHSNYITSNIGDIVPIYVEEILPSQKKKALNMGMISHMTQPYAPIFNAQYTEFRAFFVPYRLCADLLNGYSTRKSPWVKVFGEDNASTSADIIVPLANQKLPDVSTNLAPGFFNKLEAFGGVADSLDYDIGLADTTGGTPQHKAYFKEFNFLDLAAYELIYQRHYRNQNRESATNSQLYKWLFNLYNRTVDNVTYDDKFHQANREKDYFTGSQPFTQKGAPVTAGLVGEARLKALEDSDYEVGTIKFLNDDESFSNDKLLAVSQSGTLYADNSSTPSGLGDDITFTNLVADLSTASGINIEQLRIMIKTQELLEKDAIWGSLYCNSLNSHFGTCPISLVLEEPLELKKVTITSQMQPIFQTSSTANEETILGNIGANATTQSGIFEIVPESDFKEHGLLMICAVHKAQNAYDSRYYKSKRIFKKSRFDFYTPELNDLGFQPVSGLEFDYYDNGNDAVSYNEAWSEYRFKFNKIHGMFEQSRSGALNYWTLGISNVADVQSLYKQGTVELDRAINVTSAVAPQFFDAYGFIEVDTKPMSLHSIPGMDGVI